MSHPSSDREDVYPEDKVTHYPSKKMKKMAKKVVRTGRHEHAHNKGGMIGELKGLMETKHFGAKHGARHKAAQLKAQHKM